MFILVELCHGLSQICHNISHHITWYNGIYSCLSVTWCDNVWQVWKLIIYVKNYNFLQLKLNVPTCHTQTRIYAVTLYHVTRCDILWQIRYKPLQSATSINMLYFKLFTPCHNMSHHITPCHDLSRDIILLCRFITW